MDGMTEQNIAENDKQDNNKTPYCVLWVKYFIERSNFFAEIQFEI